MSRKNRVSRREFLRLSSLAAGSALLAACAPQATSAPTTVPPTTALTKPPAPTSAPAATQVPATATAVPTAAPTKPTSLKATDYIAAKDMPGSPKNPRGWTTNVPDIPQSWVGQKPLTFTVTRRVDSGTKFAEGDSLENNPFTRMLEQVSGVKTKVAWTWSTADEAKTKYNLAIASKQLPDYMEAVPPDIFLQMAEAGLLEDITDAIKKFASPKWKKVWSEYGNQVWTWVTYKGRKYGLPHCANANQNDSILWYRKDWLDKLNLKPPKTLDELHDVALALSKSKLGKGKDGLTVGLAGTKNIYHTWACDLSPIWGAFGIIPDRWSKEGDGLMFDGIRPEAKKGLEILRKWYAEGIFRKDFYTLSEGDARNDGKGSINGLHFTPSWGATVETYQNDPATVWAFTDVPAGPDGKKGKFTASPYSDIAFCFRKGVDPLVVQRVIEIANWLIELREDTSRRFHGWENHQYKFTADNKIDTKYSPMLAHAWMIGPIGTRGDGRGDPKAAVNEVKYTMSEWTKLPADKLDAWQESYLNDPVGNVRLTREALIFIDETKASGLPTEFRSLPTPAMVAKGADMAKLMDQAYISIIIGEKPLTEFDNFVKQWKALGGDQVTKEVNDWWKANK